ncbi:MAG: response regulator transcription factor [Verrucomicrobia bacterium]|nr:response regulator transcription factor [Verrucomicrobiota bacterium]
MPQARKQTRNRKANVLIVDDHPIARQGLAQLINQEPDLHVGADVENAVQALEAIKSLKPDLAIVDITLKDGSGLELIKDIKAQFASLPTLVFSMHDESLFAERALEAGALGYVMKEEPTETIIVAIRRVLDGDIYLSKQMIDRLLKKVGNAHGQAVQSPIQVLTDRQFEIFNLYGQGKRTREIAELLHVSQKTVESHRANIMKKLNIQGAPELARYACQWGNSGA